jgi:hypothetical protein
MVIKTRFMTVRPTDVSGVGRSEVGDLFIVFKSGATHHVKYNDPKECDADHKRISDALDSDDGLKLVESED